MTGFREPDFDNFLNDMSVAIMEEDVALWASRMRRPFSMVTAAGPVTLASEDDIRHNFALYIEAKRQMGLTVVVRDPISIENCHDGTAIGTYRTHLLRDNGTRIVEPYTSSALLHPSPDNVWRMSAILNALGHHHWTGHNPPLFGD